MTTRVASIGDSLTWGFSLPDPWQQSYPAQLQEGLMVEDNCLQILFFAVYLYC